MKATFFPLGDFNFGRSQNAGDLTDKLWVDSRPTDAEGVVDSGASGTEISGISATAFPVGSNSTNYLRVGNIAGGEAQYLQVLGDFVI